MVRAATRLACVLVLPCPGRLWLCVLTLCVCTRARACGVGGEPKRESMHGDAGTGSAASGCPGCVGLKSAAQSPPQLKADRSFGLSTPFFAFILVF